MNILILTDQHPRSLGGAQNSVVLQAKYLKKNGHTVTIVSPEPAKGTAADGELDVVCYTSLPLPGGYTAGQPSKRAIRAILAQLAQREPYDIVHIQADFWGAVTGVRLAKELDLPIVVTLHNNVKLGMQKTLGTIPSAVFMLYLSVMYKKVSHAPMPITTSPDTYMTRFVSQAKEAVSPTKHFAQQLTEDGILTKDIPVTVLPTGVDDDSLAHARSVKPTDVIVWSGRLSQEKRILVFLEAIRLSGIKNPVHIYGDGPQRQQVERAIQQHHLNTVELKGAVSHPDMLTAIAGARLLVQTSVGFETQGMTVYEAALLGTHTLVCDHNISDEIDHPLVHLAEGPEAAELAVSIKTYAASDSPKAPKNRTDQQFLQSNLTLKLIGVYERALGKKS